MGESVETAVEEIIKAAAFYNKKVEEAKVLNIKVTTTPHPYGRLEIRLIQVLRELYKREEDK